LQCGHARVWPHEIARNPMDEQAVAVIRTEDAGVSHDMLLAASGHLGTQAGRGPLALADVAASRQVDRSAATCELAPRPESARAARDFTRLTLAEWRMSRLSDVAELVVSELVTNALRHGLLSARWMPGEHPIRLRLLRQDPYLMCMVIDPDSAGPVRIESHSGAESGRGLQVVESCSVRWGWQPRAGEGGLGGAGKVVWAVLQSPELRRITSSLGPGSAAPGNWARQAGRRTRRPWHPGGTRQSQPGCR
jgi:anti-sigma regulatory factor (Ser/Thr protein kinase)